MLEGTPQSNPLLLCVKAALAEPALIDEYLSLISRKTGIPQYGISLSDLEKCVDFLAKSDFWQGSVVRNLKKKYHKSGQTSSRPHVERAPESPSSSSGSDSEDSTSSSSSSSGSSGAAMDLGFSEDETVTRPAPPVWRVLPKGKAKPAIAKKPVIQESGSSSSSSSSDSESSSSESSSSSSSDSSSVASAAAPAPPPSRRLRQPQVPRNARVFVPDPKVAAAAMTSSPVLKKQRVEQEMGAEPMGSAEGSTLKASVDSTRKGPTDEGTTLKPSVQTDPVRPQEPTRKTSAEQLSQEPHPQQPSSSKTSAERPPQVPASRNMSSPAKSSSPHPQVAPDWGIDFGRLLRQAIDNRKLCPFRTLGLAPSSTMADVKKRWAKLCLHLHPDKAPVEWKSVPELVDANQAINEAKKLIEQRFQATSLVRPQKPAAHANPFTLDRGTFGKRRIEIRWNPSPMNNSRERVEKYIVFLLVSTGNRARDQMLNAGSVKEGTDPFFVIVEDDQRFTRFFLNTQSITVSIIAANGAGNSDPLTVVVPLK